MWEGMRFTSQLSFCLWRSWTWFVIKKFIPPSASSWREGIHLHWDNFSPFRRQSRCPAPPVSWSREERRKGGKSLLTNRLPLWSCHLMLCPATVLTANVFCAGAPNTPLPGVHARVLGGACHSYKVHAQFLVMGNQAPPSSLQPLNSLQMSPPLSILMPPIHSTPCSDKYSRAGQLFSAQSDIREAKELSLFA